jgi:hypothetical protein
VAEAGEDETVCVIQTRGGRIAAMQTWHGNSRGPVIEFLGRYRNRLREINFDRAGVGAYFATDFSSLGFSHVNGVNVGEATDHPNKFRNLKAQLYWALRERFQDGQVSGLTDELMLSQLATIRYEINPRGLIEIESKADAAKRGVKSPDRAEALMLAFAARTPGVVEYTRRQAELQNTTPGTEREDSPHEERPKRNRLAEVYNAAMRSVGGTDFIATSDEEDDDAGPRIRGYLATHPCAICSGELAQYGNLLGCAWDRMHQGTTAKEPNQRPPAG